MKVCPGEDGVRHFDERIGVTMRILGMLLGTVLLAGCSTSTPSLDETERLLHGILDLGVTWIDTLPAWSRALVTLGAVGSIVAAGRWLLSPLFGAIARTRLQELFTAAALLLVVGVTLLMTHVGLSPALGTFVAGVHARAWRVCAVGGFLALAVPAVAWIQESATLLLVVAVLAALVGVAFWWMWRRERVRP